MNILRDSIPSLIAKIAIPVTIGMFFNTMYNIVDTYYAGQVSTVAQSALTLSFPIFFIMMAVTTGLSVGLTSLLGETLGRKDEELTQRYLAQGSVLIGFLSIVVTLGGSLLLPQLLSLFGAEGEYLLIAKNYSSILLLSTFFMGLSASANSGLFALGNTKDYGAVLVVGFLLNLGLNPVFVHGYFGFPEMGLAGIAWATVFIQILTSLYLLWKVSDTRVMTKGFFMKILGFERDLYRSILTQSVPSAMSMVFVGVGIFIITYFIASFGEGSVAAYGIAMRIEQVFLLPLIGFNVAAITVISQNNGAGLFGRVKDSIRKTFLYSQIIMLGGAVFTFVFSQKMMMFFSSNSEVVLVGQQYLQIASFLYVLYGVAFVGDAIFRGLQKPVTPFLMGLIRQVVGPIVVFTFIRIYFDTDIKYLWYGIALILLVATIVYLRITIRQYRSLG